MLKTINAGEDRGCMAGGQVVRADQSPLVLEVEVGKLAHLQHTLPSISFT